MLENPGLEDLGQSFKVFRNQRDRGGLHGGCSTPDAHWATSASSMPRPTEKLATRRRSFSLRAMLAQKLDDFLIALFLRLIERRFPVRVLLVHVRFLI